MNAQSAQGVKQGDADFSTAADGSGGGADEGGNPGSAVITRTDGSKQVFFARDDDGAPQTFVVA